MVSSGTDIEALVAPQHTAAIMIDVQKAFTDESRPKYPPVQEVLPRLQRFVDDARAAGVLVIWVQVTHPPETNSGVWRQRNPLRSASYLAPGSEEAEFHPGFGPKEGDVHVIKHRYSAFIGTPLELILHTRDIRTVIVAGLTTDVCVSSTARDAFQRDFDVITLGDCTAEVSRNRHESGLETLGASFGQVCSSSDVVAAWQRRLAAVSR